MGKKRQRAHQVSKGERDSVNRSLLKDVRRAYMQSDSRTSNQV